MNHGNVSVKMETLKFFLLVKMISHDIFNRNLGSKYRYFYNYYDNIMRFYRRNQPSLALSSPGIFLSICYAGKERTGKDPWRIRWLVVYFMTYLAFFKTRGKIYQILILPSLALSSPGIFYSENAKISDNESG